MGNRQRDILIKGIKDAHDRFVSSRQQSRRCEQDEVVPFYVYCYGSRQYCSLWRSQLNKKFDMIDTVLIK